MFIECVIDAYVTLYNGIMCYDYIHSCRESVLKAMVEINVLLYDMMLPEPSSLSIAQRYARAYDVASFDFRNALSGQIYGAGPVWANHHLYYDESLC